MQVFNAEDAAYTKDDTMQPFTRIPQEPSRSVEPGDRDVYSQIMRRYFKPRLERIWNERGYGPCEHVSTNALKIDYVDTMRRRFGPELRRLLEQ